MDRTTTSFRSVGGFYRVKAQGRAALLFAYLKLNTQLMDNRRAKGNFALWCGGFLRLWINCQIIEDEKELWMKQRG